MLKSKHLNLLFLLKSKHIQKQTMTTTAFACHCHRPLFEPNYKTTQLIINNYQILINKRCSADRSLSNHPASCR